MTAKKTMTVHDEDIREERQEARQLDRQDEIVAAVSVRLQEHEDREFKIWEEAQGFYKQVGQSIITLNHEMGEVSGELKTLRWLVTGVLGAAFLQLVLRLLGIPL